MKPFSEKLNEILNYGALNLAIGIGYRLRIFDALESLNRSVTAAELAAETKLNERYLKEWLGIMVTGEIVELSISTSGEDLYFLPAEHARVLTRKAGNDNMGVYAQEIPMLTACAMEAVVSGFQTGQGVPFSNYPDFQNFMAELSDAKQKSILVDYFLPSIEQGRLVERLNSGISVCDLGCGQGVAVLLMAMAFPNSRFVGIDNHALAISVARKSAAREGVSNVEFMELDAATLYQDQTMAGRFDYVCAFDAIHDQSHPLEALKSVRHMLAPEGLFSMVDINASSSQMVNQNHSMGPFLYTVSLMHCMPVGLNDNGMGLGMMWGRKKAKTLLADAGFDRIEILEMDYDAFNVHFLCS